MSSGIKTGGRTTGTPNRRTMASRRDLEARADPLGFLVEVLDGKVMNGVTPTLADRMAAARELRRVLVPDCRERPLAMHLPPVMSAADLPAAFSAMLKAVSEGEITPSEARSVVDILEGARKAYETADLADRVAKLEACAA